MKKINFVKVVRVLFTSTGVIEDTNDESNTIKIEVLKNDMGANNMPYIVGYNPKLEEGIEYTGEQELCLRRIGYEQSAELSLMEDAFIMPTDIIFATKERVEYGMRRSSGNREIYGDELLSLFDYYYKQIMNGFMSVDEGVAAYRARATELGVEEYIAALNNKLDD